jgi:predicted nucleotidyltransferase
MIDRDLAEVKDIVFRHLAGRKATVYLFGSRARGTARASSDIDVAIEGIEPIPNWLFSEIRDALEESTVPFNVDVVNLNEVSPEFREAVMRDGIRWDG